MYNVYLFALSKYSQGASGYAEYIKQVWSRSCDDAQEYAEARTSRNPTVTTYPPIHPLALSYIRPSTHCPCYSQHYFLYSCALNCLEPENLPSDIIEATCRPHFTFSGDGSISGIHPLRWPIMSPGLIMSRLPRSPLGGICPSGILIDRQRGKGATPQCFDQTRRWECDVSDFLSPWIESTIYEKWKSFLLKKLQPGKIG